MALADTVPATWSIAGLHGPDSGRLPVRLTETVSSISYEVARFPATVTPSPFAPAYTTATGFNVADRFEHACRHIVTRSATARACNTYFRGLGRSAGRPADRQYSLADLLRWRIVFYFWRPVSRAGPVPTSGSFHAPSADVLTDVPETRFAEIVVSEHALVTAMTLAATIVHELAHIAGAPGATDADRSRVRALRRADPASYRRLIAAEGALPPCLLGSMFDPDAIGAVHDLEQADRAGRRVIS
jgi:hypothetical protein